MWEAVATYTVWIFRPVMSKLPRIFQTTAAVNGLWFFIGIHRHIVALGQAPLSIKWSTLLPQTDGDVSLVVSSGIIYAGCAGRIFCLNFSGDITLTRGLLSGGPETRIALHHLCTLLFVGVDGYAAALDARSFGMLEFSLMLQPYAARFPGFMGGLPNAV